jgi:hypothetical protein
LRKLKRRKEEMRHGICHLMLVLLPLCLVAALLPGGMVAAQEEETTIQGEVRVHEEDDEGQILSIYVSDETYGDCLVAKGRQWEGLVKHVGETVRVTGLLSETDEPGFWYVIQVSRFSKVQDEPEYDEREYDEPYDDPDQPE